MNPNDYKFKVGDRVISIYGEIGRITEICTCDKCVERGFYELTWAEDGVDGNPQYITNWDAENGFMDFRQIGEYKFDHAFEKDSVLRNIEEFEKVVKDYKKRLQNIEELEQIERIADEFGKIGCTSFQLTPEQIEALLARRED